MSTFFPRTEVAGISMPRMLMGTNWLLGYSHTGLAADNLIKDRHSSPESVAEVAAAYLEYGVDAMMAPAFTPGTPLEEGLRLAEKNANHRIIRIVTPFINVEDTAAGRREAETAIRKCRDEGATFCLIHHASCEQLVRKDKQIIERLPEYLDMIRQNDMIPGLSAHMPEIIQYSDLNEYDVQTYIQIYNCMGFLMQIEVEGVNSIIWKAKKPVMTIKSMAAGRCTPFVGITFSYNTIRDCDMVTVGAFTPDEVHEDVEIALAAIEHRHPVLSKRSSPAMTSLLAARN